LHQDFEALKKAFFKQFDFKQTAGGVVRNDEGEILMIFRRGKWDLPKGKIDEGETLEECAAREVEEETGVKNLSIIRKVTVTYHTYKEYGKQILKESHWFEMISQGKQKLIAQTEEDITDIEWVKPGEITKKFDNTFPLIKEVLAEFVT
jgi:8-oxo-dGTP pyrophosphatase MutT (NUDIX family)